MQIASTSQPNRAAATIATPYALGVLSPEERAAAAANDDRFEPSSSTSRTSTPPSLPSLASSSEAASAEPAKASTLWHDAAVGGMLALSVGGMVGVSPAAASTIYTYPPVASVSTTQGGATKAATTPAPAAECKPAAAAVATPEALSATKSYINDMLEANEMQGVQLSTYQMHFINN